jgi:hypothetical protein
MVSLQIMPLVRRASYLYALMRRVKTVLVQVLVGVIFLEVLLRVLYFQKLGNDRIAIVSAYKSVAFRASDNYRQRLIDNHNIIRPDSAGINKDIVDEVIASNSFEYAPWADFKLVDFEGRYINSKGFLRKSIPAGAFEGGTDTLRIFFFGGSTMFGFDVIDRETIPSAFASVYAERCNGCKTMNVYNYGVLSYYSYNELMLFHHLLATGTRPDVVIFLDGLNDLFMVQAARQRVPWYYFRLKENIQNRKDSTASLFQLTAGQTVKSAAEDAIKNYLENIAHIKKLCRAYNIAPYFFIQPTPYYDYPGKKQERVADTERNDVIEYGYPILQSKCDSSANMFYLGDMLRNETKPAFIDEIHYSPYMNRKIAEQIFNRMQHAFISPGPSTSETAVQESNRK